MASAKAFLVANGTSSSCESVAQLKGSLLGKGTKNDLPRLGQTEEQQVQRAKNDAEGLAGAWSSDHEQGTAEVTDDLALNCIELWVVCQDGWCNGHRRSAFQELETPYGGAGAAPYGY